MNRKKHRLLVRPLRFEPLESRRVLSITVNTLVDENNGVGVGAGTSLREAIAAAAQGDTINFSVAGTINLTVGPSNSEKQLVIDKGLTISGPGQNLLTIRAFDPTPGVWNADGSGVFLIDDGNSAVDRNVTISGVTLTGGDVGLHGGAIQSRENVTLKSSAVSGNSALNGGGGVWVYEANLSLVNSTISGNEARFGGGVVVEYGDLTISSTKIQSNAAAHGSSGLPAISPCGPGGIVMVWGALTITDSAISNNDSHGSAGGIGVSFGNVNITSSTISGNRALGDDVYPEQGFVGGYAGGIWSDFSTLNIRNSTISGNSARLSCGGIWSYRGGSAVITGSTITGNRADASAIGGGTGGGICADVGVPVTLDETIVAGNLRGNSTRDDVAGAFTARYSLIGDSTGATFNSLVGNLIGDGAVPIDPLLGPLADNGGPTLTHALLGGSPAVDAGDPTAASGNDQRGASFLRVIDGDGVNGARIDMGALEAQPNQPAGDYTRSGLVDAADYVLWRKTRSATGLPAYSGADGNGDGAINSTDYGVWRAHFGQQFGAASRASVEVAGNGTESFGSVAGESVTATPFAGAQGVPPGVFSVVSVPVVRTAGISERARILNVAEPGSAGRLRDDALVALVESAGRVRDFKATEFEALGSESIQTPGDKSCDGLDAAIGEPVSTALSL
jgi:hypothetical protein